MKNVGKYVSAERLKTYHSMMYADDVDFRLMSWQHTKWDEQQQYKNLRIGRRYFSCSFNYIYILFF
jgi:hypothetical protein